MIVDNFPDYIIDTEFLSGDELDVVVSDVKNLTYVLNPSIGAADNGIEGITGSNFSDKLIAVSEYRVGGSLDNPLLPIATSLVNKFCSKHGLKFLELYRTRVNVTFMTTDNRPLSPHVDLRNAYKHYILLLFFNDSDGDTIAYDLKADGSYHTQDELIVLQRFSPASGKAVLFDGDFFHAWEAPKLHDYRLSMIANISIEPEPSTRN